jgi:hypothetical protein
MCDQHFARRLSRMKSPQSPTGTRAMMASLLLLPALVASLSPALHLGISIWDALTNGGLIGLGLLGSCGIPVNLIKSLVVV